MTIPTTIDGLIQGLPHRSTGGPNGATIYRGSRYDFDEIDGSRYHFDGCLLGQGFQQYDTENDAWYFGIWVNVATHTIVSYMEGDIEVAVYPGPKSFRAELQAMGEYYGDPPPAFVVLDQDESGAWTRTEGFDLRPGE
jgi:hypothetical protein